MTAYVHCRQVVKAYQVSNHEIVALRGIDFQMAQGEMVAIIGPSGAGKSSLLNLLGGLDKPTAGQLSVDGLNLLTLKGKRLSDYRLKQVGFIWQQVERNLFTYRNALHNVTLPMMLAGVGWRERRKQAFELLEAVGMTEHAYKMPSQLSGGQQQRVAIAVGLANHPQLLLADEPTGALDRQTAEQVMALMNELRQRYGLTVLMVTHDMEISRYADRVLTLRDGSLGQDLSHVEDLSLKLDDAGQIKLPQMAQAQLHNAEQIAVEIRPEGVLLRPQTSEQAEEWGVQEKAPDKPKRFAWFRRRRS